MKFAKSWSLLKTLCVSSAFLLHGTGTAAAQDEAVVEVLAQLMSLEDSRTYDPGVLRDATRHPDRIVRRHAALALGRIGDDRAVPLLEELLLDRDSSVEADAAFSLGLLGNLGGYARLRELVLNTPVDQQHGAHEEAVTAILRIGGSEAREFFREYLDRFVGRVGSAQMPPALVRALGEAWRLGDSMPGDLMRPFTDSDDVEVQWATIYSLARVRDPESADLILAATDSPVDSIRFTAVRALNAAYADSSGLDRRALADRVRRLLNDSVPFVRINALRALGTYADPSDASDVIDRVSDSDPNVRVQAAAALGQIGGNRALEELRERVDDGLFAVRREALLGLARHPGSGVFAAVAPLVSSNEWRERMTAAQVLGRAGGDTALAWLDHLSQDPDGRVVGQALAGIIRVDSAYGTELAREYVLHPDFVVRTIAAGRLGEDGVAGDVPLLADGYQLSLSDGQPDARIAIVSAVGKIASRSPQAEVAAEAIFLARFPSSGEYLVRRAAAENFPEAAARWGPERPTETRRVMGDYREIVRRLLLPDEMDNRRPRIRIETDVGQIIVELFASDAPLTTQAMLELLDLRVLEDGAWHRVVPNFVLQDGDPRGDGWGGPDYVLRDELNRRRYDRGVVGMALSGPDTGGSQFFIAHTAQPHLNGIYTVIGRVVVGYNVVNTITQGDHIRRIRRE